MPLSKNAEQKIKIALVDDQYLFREGLISLLKEFREFDIILEAANGRELIDALEKGKRPNVVLLDLDMPVMNGVKTAEVLRKNYPEIKIIMLTMHNDYEFVNRFYKMGANGFLLKDEACKRIVEAVKFVMENDTFFSSIALEKGNKSASLLKLTDLSAREIEIVTLVCRQFSTKEIADALCIGVRTVDRHRDNLMKKIGARNIAGIVMFGIKNKLDLLPIKRNKNK